MGNNIDYAEYIAEHISSDRCIDYVNYIVEHLDASFSYAEYISEHIGYRDLAKEQKELREKKLKRILDENN